MKDEEAVRSPSSLRGSVASSLPLSIPKFPSEPISSERSRQFRRLRIQKRRFVPKTPNNRSAQKSHLKPISKPFSKQEKPFSPVTMSNIPRVRVPPSRTPGRAEARSRPRMLPPIRTASGNERFGGLASGPAPAEDCRLKRRFSTHRSCRGHRITSRGSWHSWAPFSLSPVARPGTMPG